LYWRHFAKPASQRSLIRHLLEHPIGSVMEIGMGDGQRTRRVLELIQRSRPIETLRYVGVDLFESSEGVEPHLTLKQAHRMLSELGVKGQLIPGDVGTTLPRVAHSVQPCQLVIVDGYDHLGASQTLEHWLPRLVASGGQVFCSKLPGASLDSITVMAAVDAARRAA
jgi:hypothetical protein